MKKYSILPLVLTVIVFASCLNINPPAESKDPEIKSFNLVDIKGSKFDGITYTIDQTKGYITCSDSLPYSTNIDSLVPMISGRFSDVVASYSSDFSTKINLIDERTDTMSFKDTVFVKTTSENKKHSKIYKIFVYKYKNDPEQFSWKSEYLGNMYPAGTTAEKLLAFQDSLLYLYVSSGSSIALFTKEKEWQSASVSGLPTTINIEYIVCDGAKFYAAEGSSLYTSEDGKTWTNTSVSGSVDHLYFELNKKIYGISNSDLTLYALNLEQNGWEKTTALPNSFPIDGASICTGKSTSGISRIFVIGGVNKDNQLLNSVWATENGSYWANFGSSEKSFSPRRDVAAFQYLNKLMIVGGADNNGMITENYHLYSPDLGINWKNPDSTMLISHNTLFTPRSKAQVALTKKHLIVNIVGGKSSPTNFIKDYWKGYNNRAIWALK